MIEFSSFNMHRLAIFMLIICLLYQNVNLSWSLNEEGLALLKFRERVFSDPFGALLDWNEEVGVIDPCSWSGVECANGNVVALNLKNLCLGGTMAPDIKTLVHLKSIILRNNSFSGNIPEEIGELKELEVVDMGYNNFSGPLPSVLGNNLSLKIILLDNNELFGSMSPEIDELKFLSEVQVDENQLSNSGQSSSGNARSTSWNTVNTGHITQRRLLKVDVADPLSNHQNNFPAILFSFLSSRRSSSSQSKSPSPSPLPSPSPSPSPSSFPNPKSTSTTVSVSPPSLSSPEDFPTESPSTSSKSSRSNQRALILFAAIGSTTALVFLLAIGIYFCRSNKISAVKPCSTTGLSGQLQKALVTGVPNLKRSELETACEDFSNVIGSSSMGTVYKGTLSSGVEIAVTSLAVESAKEWPENLESQFRKKIDQLSKVNHKNFVNLIGYCEEQEPFTRMMVFEYAPNGTLFEHLHIREAEPLDWGMRMRIAMGMAYCLEHMHQLKPPKTHNHLNSSAVKLTEDYAAKISDFGLWNEFAATEMESNPESNIYSFGVILFEMITGKLPYSVDSFSLQDWASDYLRGEQPLREMVDPMLKSFHVEQLEKFGEVIKSCCHPNPKQRPTMREVTARVREITGIGFDEAVPKLSPLWRVELEILSTEAM